MAAKMKVDIEINYAGIGEIAKSPEVRTMVDEAANRIAEAVRGQVDADIPVVVQQYTTDRDAASVTIASRRGLGLQAQHGVLTRAASSIGADVRIRG